MTDNQPQLSGRDKSGRFASGPANIGRPKGAKGKVARERLQFVKGLGDVALQKLREAVERGEKWALELTLKAILPATRTIEFEGMTVADIEAATMEGDISPDEMRALSTALSRLRQIDDLETIRMKLIELEAIVHDGSNK